MRGKLDWCTIFLFAGANRSLPLGPSFSVGKEEGHHAATRVSMGKIERQEQTNYKKLIRHSYWKMTLSDKWNRKKGTSYSQNQEYVGKC